MMFNMWAVLSATIAAYLAGALWYSPLFFLRSWCRETDTPLDKELSHPVRVYGFTFLSTLISALILHWLLGPQPSMSDALLTGLLTGAGIVSMSLAVNYQFREHSLKLWLIDSGFHCLRFLLMGLVLALWA